VSDDALMADDAMPYGLAVTTCNSLDFDGLIDSWQQLHTALGQGTLWVLNVVRDIASAEVTILEADNKGARRQALARQKGAAQEATRIIGTYCVMSHDRGAMMLTSLGTAAKGLSEALIARHRRFSRVTPPNLDFAAAAARGALNDSATIDAWPAEALAKALLAMLEATSGRTFDEEWFTG